MASTYSSSLRLELMGNGDQSGTWGTTTNTNLGTLIEQAIAGVATVTLTSDANYTLSTANGATDEARNMVITIDSSVSLTATRTITIPSVKKLYVLKNSTSGSQSLSIKTAAGSAFTLINGTMKFIYCDGTNIAEISGPLTAIDGQIISTRANNTADNAGQIFLNGAAGNRIDFATAGNGAPVFTTRTDGTKIVLRSAISGSTTDFAIGLQSTALWFTVPNTTDSFKWFGATTQAAILSGAGALTLTAGLTATTGTFSAALSATTGTFSSSLSATTGTFSTAIADGNSTTTAATTAYVCTGWWESAEQTITTNTQISVAHGLGRNPQERHVFMRCKTAEFGYAVGDEMDFGVNDSTSGSTYNHHPYLTSNTTTVSMWVTQNLNIINKSTGATTTPTLASWRIVFRAR